MSEHLNLLKSVLIFTNPKGQHNSSLAYQKMDEVQYQTSIYVATEDIPAGVAISDARWAKKLDNSTAYQAELARQTAEGEREQAEDAREVAEGLREQGEVARGNAYSQAESARDGLYATAESARDDLFTGSQQDRTSAYNLRENQRDDAYAAAELIREGAETARETAEGLRDEAEGLRLSAEISRNTAEGLRDDAETARKEAEVLRVAAEAARMGFKPMGAYNPANENKYGEWYTHEGGSYGYIWPEPSTGVPVTDTTHWQQIASRGMTGPSAYDAAVAGGYTGTEEKFLDDLAATDGLAPKLAEIQNDFSEAVGAVTVDSEVVLARGGKTILGDRLDENERLIRGIERGKGWEFTPRRGVPSSSVVTFISDDADIGDYDLLLPIFTAAGVPLNIAVVTSRVGQSNTMTWNQLQELQNTYGFEIASHTHTHSHLTTLTDEQIHFECTESRRLLEENGLVVNGMCIPHGDYDNRVKSICQNYFRMVRTTYSDIEPGYINKIPIQNLELSAFFIDSDGLDFNTCKAKIDQLVALGAWVILGMHGYSMRGSAEKLQLVSDVLDYVNSINLPAVNFTEGMNLFGSLIDIGPNSEFRVGPDGKLKSKMLVVDKGPNFPSAHLPNELDLGCINVSNIDSTGKPGYPNNLPGTLIAYAFMKGTLWDWVFEEYHVYNSPTKFRRSALNSSTWGEWVQIYGQPPIAEYVQDNLDSEHTPNSLRVNCITISNIDSTGKLGYPNNLAGTLIAYAFMKGTLWDWVFEEYHVYNSPVIYRRSALSGTAWSPWLQMTIRASTTANRPVSTFAGNQYFDTTLGKPIWCKTAGETPVWVDATGTVV